MVTVELPNGGTQKWSEATSFDVSAEGRLILFADRKPFAVYAAGHWAAAHMRPEDV